jgi:hypothetical protein
VTERNRIQCPSAKTFPIKRAKLAGEQVPAFTSFALRVK